MQQGGSLCEDLTAEEFSFLADGNHRGRRRGPRLCERISYHSILRKVPECVFADVSKAGIISEDI